MKSALKNKVKNEILVKVLSDRRIQFMIFSVLTWFVCTVEYNNFILNIYTYHHYPDQFSLNRSVISFLLLLVGNIIMFTRNSEFVRGFSALFILLFFIPILIVFQYSNSPGNWLFILCSFIFLLIFNANFNLRVPKTRLLSKVTTEYFLVLLVILFFLPFLLTFKINFNSELFEFGLKIYEIRAEVRESENIFTGYMLSPLFQFILPILAIYGLANRKLYLTISAVLLTVLLYMINPQKSIFFGIFVVVFFYFFRSPLKKVIMLSLIILFGLFFGVYLANSSDSIILESLLLRRYLIAPAFLNVVYYDFFNGEEFRYGYSFLKTFYTYPYEKLPAYIIGSEFFDGSVLNANNGFLSDSYINFGKRGIVITTVLVAVLMKFFDALKIEGKYFGLFFLLMGLLRSSAFPTMLLTHGVWFFILASFFILRKYDEPGLQRN